MKNCQIVYIAFILSLIGCDFGSSPKRIVENYFLSEINGQTEISYNLKKDEFVGVVGPQIMEVGYNSSFVIAKKRNVEFGNNGFIGEIEYYIIPIKEKVANSPDDNKIGPLQEAEFKEKMKHFGISDIDFTIKVE